MNMIEAIKSGYSNYANFSGRSVRSAYWWWALFQIVVSVAISLVEGGGTAAVGDGMASMAYNPGIVGLIWSLANLIPGVAVSVRRMHDLDKSGWLLLIVLIPVIGALVLLYWFCQRGTEGDNQYGPAV